MYLHATYAVSAQRVPLGVLDAWMWAREPKPTDASRGGLLESVRWVEGYERLGELAVELPATKLVCVGDRESDLLALLVKARDLGHAADYLLRCQHNRVLPEGGKLWAAVLQSAPLGRIRSELPAGLQRIVSCVEGLQFRQKCGEWDVLNPADMLWRELRQRYLSNRLWPDIDALDSALASAWLRLSDNTARLRCLTHFSWINAALAQLNKLRILLEMRIRPESG